MIGQGRRRLGSDTGGAHGRPRIDTALAQLLVQATPSSSMPRKWEARQASTGHFPWPRCILGQVEINVPQLGRLDMAAYRCSHTKSSGACVVCKGVLAVGAKTRSILAFLILFVIDVRHGNRLVEAIRIDFLGTSRRDGNSWLSATSSCVWFNSRQGGGTYLFDGDAEYGGRQCAVASNGIGQIFLGITIALRRMRRVVAIWAAMRMWSSSRMVRVGRQ